MASGGVVYRKIRGNMPASRIQYHKFSTKPCTFKGYRCPQFCIEGYYFCIRHILEDDSAPFQQCSFSYPFTMKRCPQAAPQCEFSESYCPEHFYKMQRTRNRMGKSQPPVSMEKLLSTLGHVVKPSTSSNVKGDSAPLNPFVDIDANAVNSSLSNVLDYCSESDSDVDTSIIARTTRCKDEESSDAESADSAGEDILKFASVLTSEEALQRAKDKSVRLQTLYREQLNRLKHVLRERRRDYLSAIHKEKETLCSIAEQSAGSVRDLKLVEKIKGYNHYRKFLGPEANLRKKMRDKRRGLGLDGTTVGRGGGWKCVFTEGGVKCNARTLPNGKFCQKHILHDPFQVLFRPCGFVSEDNTCREPLPGMEPCIYHMGMIPAQLSYNTALSSEEEEGELKEELQPVKEEEVDVVNGAGSSVDVGTELHEMKEELADDGGLLMDADTFGMEEEVVMCDDTL